MGIVMNYRTPRLAVATRQPLPLGWLKGTLVVRTGTTKPEKGAMSLEDGSD
jgi:hypothetical protein